ncbi:hypothetical protein SDC9_60825 [bioreactor metagenome]|uniref:Glycosyltransferase 2-like domain-containing protein n=1 Tax=bioreactor metagenome TaxID=1076179 RepID=A0A644XE46_9ZZZZ
MNLMKFAKSILWTIFPPERPVERMIRTQYHRITATDWYVRRTLRQSAASYNKWLKYQAQQLNALNNPLNTPLFTFIILNNAAEQLKGTLHSIQAQLGENNEVLLVSPEPVPGLASARGLVEAVAQSRGEWVICCAAGDQFDEHSLQQFRMAIDQHPQTNVLYADSSTRASGKGQETPFFKPSGYSPELLLSVNYLTRAAIKKEAALQALHQVHAGFEFFNQERELLLLLSEGPSKPVHIAYTLVHQVECESSSIEANTLLRDHLLRLGYPTSITVEGSPESHVAWQFGSPSVSIIIPTRNSFSVLKTLLDSLFVLTDYPNFEVILVDNGSTQPEVLAYYEELQKSKPVRIVPYNAAFNYSHANNLGAANSQADYLLFLNNDMQVIHSNWLSELVMWASQPDIGVVGTKLLHANNSIQHAGVVLGLQNFVGHLYLNTPEHYHGLLGSVDWYRNVSAVTGACQMMRRSTFNELGGFDEAYTLVFSDVALCLAAISKGFRVLYNPHACLYHLEGGSRGYKSPRPDMLRGFDLLQEWVIHDDPYFSPNLTYTTIPACQLEYQDAETRLAVINERRKFLLK